MQINHKYLVFFSLDDINLIINNSIIILLSVVYGFAFYYKQ